MFRARTIATTFLGIAVCLFALGCSSTTTPSEPFRASRDLIGSYNVELNESIVDKADTTRSWPVVDGWIIAKNASAGIDLRRFVKRSWGLDLITYDLFITNDTTFWQEDTQLTFSPSSTSNSATGTLRVLVESRTKAITRTFTLTRVTR